MIAEIAFAVPSIACLIYAVVVGRRLLSVEPNLLPAARQILVAIVGWMVVDAWLAYWNVFRDPIAGPVPGIAVGVMAPFLIFGIGWIASAGWRAVLTSFRPDELIAVQVYRALGAIFVMLWLVHRLPPHFAIPAGFGDVAVGVMAIPTARALASRSAGATSAAFWWNVAGIFDLLVALTMGFACAPTPLRFIFTDPSTRILAELPIVMIPTALVPLSIITHLLTLRGLRTARERAGAVAAAGAA